MDPGVEGKAGKEKQVMDKVVGIHSVTQALKAGSGERLMVREGGLNQRQQSLVALAEELGVEVVRGNIAHGDLADQGVTLEVAPARFKNEKELESLLGEQRDNWLFLILDGITDPRNFGACLRSAASFAVDGVIVPRDKSAPLNDAAIKTASGAASLVPVFEVVNLVRAMEKMKASGIWTVGTVLDTASELLPQIDLKGSIALIMGAEGVGIRQKTRKHSDFLAEIPSQLPDLSLNVSVATGICLYEVRRQRGS